MRTRWFVVFMVLAVGCETIVALLTSDMLVRVLSTISAVSLAFYGGWILTIRRGNKSNQP